MAAPTQVGSAVTKGFGASYPMAAPTGLAEDDVVVVQITDYALGDRSLSGFTEVTPPDFNLSGKRCRVLIGLMGSSPPANFSPTGGLTNDDVIITAWRGVDFANIDVQTGTRADDGSGAWTLPGITVDTSESLLLVCSNGITAITGFTQAGAVSDLEQNQDEFTAGASGGLSATLIPSTVALWAILVLPPPSAGDYTPENLNATTIDSDSIGLTWDAVPGVSRYAVERDGVIIDNNVLTNSYTDNGLSPSTLYSYYVMSVLP
jgi:hypothetical protein